MNLLATQQRQLSLVSTTTPGAIGSCGGGVAAPIGSSSTNWSHRGNKRSGTMRMIGRHGWCSAPPVTTEMRNELLLSLSLSSSSSSNDSNNAGIDDDKDNTIPEQQQPRQRLDPLMMALTRDDTLSSLSSSKVAVASGGGGELDQSLFLIVPLIGFAVGGILLSIYILLNSGDAFVGDLTATTTSTTSSVMVDTDACRGICSSQQQDLEGLRNYMNGFNNKK